MEPLDIEQLHLVGGGYGPSTDAIHDRGDTRWEDRKEAERNQSDPAPPWPK